MFKFIVILSLAALCCALPLDEKDKLSLPSPIASSESSQLKPQDNSNVQKIKAPVPPVHKRDVHDHKEGSDHAEHDDHHNDHHDEHQTQPQTAPLSHDEKHKREAPKADAPKPSLGSQTTYNFQKPASSQNGQQIKSNNQQNPAVNAQNNKRETPKVAQTPVASSQLSNNQQKQGPTSNNGAQNIPSNAQPAGQNNQRHKRQAPKVDTQKQTSPVVQQVPNQQKVSPVNVPAAQVHGQVNAKREAPKPVASSQSSNNQQKQVPTPNNGAQIKTNNQQNSPAFNAQQSQNRPAVNAQNTKTGPTNPQQNAQRTKREAPKADAPKPISASQPALNQQKQVPTPANNPQIKINGQQINPAVNAQNNKRETPKVAQTPVASSQPLNNQQKQVPTPNNAQNIKSGSNYQQQNAQPISQTNQRNKRETPKVAQTPIASSQPLNNQQKQVPTSNNGAQIKSNNQQNNPAFNAQQTQNRPAANSQQAQNRPAVNSQQTQNRPAVNSQQTQNRPAVNTQNTKTGPTNPQQNAQKTKREAPKVELPKPIAANQPPSNEQKQVPTPSNARPVGQSNGQQHRRDVPKPVEQPKPASVTEQKPKLAAAATHPLETPSRTRRDAPQPAVAAQKPLAVSNNDNQRDSYDDQKPPTYVHPVPVSDVLKAKNSPAPHKSSDESHSDEDSKEDSKAATSSTSSSTSTTSKSI